MDSPVQLGPQMLRTFRLGVSGDRRRAGGDDPRRPAPRRHRGRGRPLRAAASRRSCAKRAPSMASCRLTSPAPTRSSPPTRRAPTATAWSTATAPSLTAPAALAQSERPLLGTVAHEFFHAWNVERIRPRSLEPFNFDDANVSGELWVAEGFTQYYGALLMARAGLAGARGRPGDRLAA